MFNLLKRWEEIVTPESSFVTSVARKGNKMRVKIANHEYEYRGVPDEEWDALSGGKVDSVGRHYNQNIKGKFKSKKRK